MERFETTVLTLLEGMLLDAVTRGRCRRNQSRPNVSRKGFPHRRPDNEDFGTIEALLNQIELQEMNGPVKREAPEKGDLGPIIRRGFGKAENRKGLGWDAKAISLRA
jgi:hypothetical protein